MASLNAESRGIFASDIFLRTSLQAAYSEIIQNEAQLRQIFSGLLFDPLTQEIYGEKEVSAAVDWIKNNEVKIYTTNSFQSNPTTPAVVVHCVSSEEAANTLNDNAFEPTEFLSVPEFEVPAVSPIDFSLESGELTLPFSWIESYGVSAGMKVFDANGVPFTVSSVLLPDTIFLTEQNIQADFSTVNINWENGNAVATVGEALFRESYQITMYSQGEMFYAQYLYSLIEYLLLSIRDSVLAPRGMDVSSVRSGPIEEDRFFGGNNLMFARTISFESIVHKTWFKTIKPRPRMAYIRQLENV